MERLTEGKGSVHPSSCTSAKALSLHTVHTAPSPSVPVAPLDVLCLTMSHFKGQLLRYRQINQYLLAAQKHESPGEHTVWVEADNSPSGNQIHEESVQPGLTHPHLLNLHTQFAAELNYSMFFADLES